MAIYLYYMSSMFEAGDFNDADAGVILGTSVFYLIGLSIVVNIILAIIMAVINAAVTGEEQKDLADERDKLISLRGMQMSFITFSAGFLAFMLALAWGYSAILVLFLIICTMFVSSITGDLAKLYFYRRGV